MRRKIGALLILVLLIGGGYFMFRTHTQTLADEEGNPITYTYEDLEEEGLTGLFVHNEDDTFSPSIQSMPNFDGEASKADSRRFLWYVEGDKSVTDLIPTVGQGSELVVIYNVDGDLRGSYYLEKYAERGYTIGAHFYVATDKSMYLEASDVLRGSQAASVLGSMEENTDNIYQVESISGTETLPINNVDQNMELLLGLEKNKLYQVVYYQGTRKKKATFAADAKVFQSERMIPITTPYKKTDYGYFVVNLPQNLADGYYYLSNIGFFKYER